MKYSSKNKPQQIAPFIFIAMALLAASCQTMRHSTAITKTDFTAYDLPDLSVKGPVKTIKQSLFWVKKDTTDFVRYKRGGQVMIHFDTSRHPVKFVSHYADGQLDLLYKYRYNQQGQLVYLQKSQWDKTPEVIQRFYYDEKGRIRNLKSFVWDTTVVHFQYADSHQRYIRKKYNPQDEVEQVRIISFKHNLKKVVYKNYDNLLNSTGRLIDKKIIVYRDGKMIRREEYKDKDGGLHLYGKRETTYNKQGQWTRIHMKHPSSEEAMIVEKKAEYNRQGRLAKVSETLRKGEKERCMMYRFLYDDKENWTLKKVYVNGILRKELQRDISYYTDGIKDIATIAQYHQKVFNLNRSTVITMILDSLEVEQRKARYGAENFAVEADDQLWYQAKMHRVMDSLNIPVKATFQDTIQIQGPKTTRTIAKDRTFGLYTYFYFDGQQLRRVSVFDLINLKE